MRRLLRVLLVFLAIVIAGAGAFVWSIVRFDARTVIPGAVYRSKQPVARQLESVIAADHLRTVVNLRGKNEQHGWYREEVRVCRDTGVAHYDIPFSTYNPPPRIEVQRLVAAIDSAPRPMLLHCEAGNDRAGWASSVALLLAGQPLATAQRQLSLRYGHVCANPCRLHEFFDAYRRWLAETKTLESAGAFRRWATAIYCPEPYCASIQAMMDTPVQVATGTAVRTTVSVRNDSHSRWGASTMNGRGIRLGARVAGPFGQWPADPVAPFRGITSHPVDVYRDSTARSVDPGRSFSSEVAFAAPVKPGRYLVQFDMVDEGVHWFSDLGGPGAITHLVVVDSPRLSRVAAAQK